MKSTVPVCMVCCRTAALVVLSPTVDAVINTSFTVNVGELNVGGVNVDGVNVGGVNVGGVNVDGVNVDGVNVGGQNLTSPMTFSYRGNPVIESISPDKQSAE